MLLAGALADPFAFFQPTARVTPREISALSRGEAFARAVDAPDGQVAIVAAVPVRVDGDRLVSWIREIAALKASTVVQAIGRFSSVPSVSDVQTLSLDAADLDEIASCEPARCGVKLAPHEILRIRAAMGSGAARSEDAGQRAFREVVVARAESYLRNGRTGTQPPAFLAANWPDLSEEVRAYPRGGTHRESFLYWSKDAYGGKPIISVTHVTVARSERPGRPEVLIVGRQVFATHYEDDSWSCTALMRDGAGRYLVYVNLSQLDVLNTWYGGIVRRVVQRRLRGEAADVLNGLRQRLERGEPPGSAVHR